MRITDNARALLLSGETIGAELPASDPDRRAWVSVFPYVREKNRIGVEVEHRYGGVGDPKLHVLRFEIEASAVEALTYDYDRYMSNVQRIEIDSDEGMDVSIEKLEQILTSWGIDPARLGALGEDYPIL
jgi:hypothetical protein